MAIAQATIGATDTVVLTVPATKSYAITTIMVCNTAAYDAAGTNDTSFDLHFVQQSQPKSNTNMVVKEMPVPGGETFTFDSEKVILSAGDTVTLLSQAPLNLSVTVSYLEVYPIYGYMIWRVKRHIAPWLDFIFPFISRF